jgi:hypothetical protein
MQIDILKPQRPYSSRLVPGYQEMFILALIGILLFGKGYFDPSNLEFKLLMMVVFIGLGILIYYKNTYQPAQYYINHIFTKDNSIHFVSSFRDREAQEAVFDYRHISCKFQNRSRGTRGMQNNRVEIKVCNPGNVDFETIYIIATSRDWKENELRQFEEDFTKWKSELISNNPLG